MTKEQKFYKALQDVFIGAKIEGKGGFVNLMRIKSNYYRKIEKLLKADVEKALEKYPSFRDELFDKLYSFFSRYFTESGSIYFNSTPFHNNIYEKVYTNEKDVILFWKTQMLYYVKTDRIFRSLPVEFDGFKFYFDASKIENKKANEKRSLVFELDKVQEDQTIVFSVLYSERGTKTKQDEILKAIKKKGIAISEEQLERAFRVFEKQSEVDFFINKNAKAFLQEQFKLWSYQYFWEGAKEWSADRVNQLQILKDIAFKIIDLISQFEDELVKIWNKPKFVKNSNYVITLDRVASKQDGIFIVEKILNHKNIEEQVKEWKELGIVDENFKVKDVFENSPFVKGRQTEGLTGYLNLPYNPKLKQKARELRKSGNLSEVLLWNKLKQGQMLGFDFTCQQVIGNYIVDFHCPKLNLVIEIDGESHNFKGEYDEERDKYLQSLGLTVLHFKDIDIKKSLSEVLMQIENCIKNTPSARQTPLLIKGEFRHLPIDTKYFKDLEIEILSQFEDLDKSLDGWLIKSENYQALNTILPKFKEKVQTIYIDPPFNLDSSDQFLYRTNYKDANWATLLENRLRIAKDWLNERGSIFVRCDYNGNWIVRCLMDEIFDGNFINEIDVGKTAGKKKTGLSLSYTKDNIFFYAKNSEYIINETIKETYDYSFFKEVLKILNRNNFSDTSKLSDILLNNLFWVDLDHRPGERQTNKTRNLLDIEFDPPKGRHWIKSQEKLNQLYKVGKARLRDKITGKVYYKKEELNTAVNKDNLVIQVFLDTEIITDNWTDINGYSQASGFQTENSEILLKRALETASNKTDLILDFFLGSGTTTAVAHKLGRKWIGVEMGEHFYTVVLPRMKKVLAYDKSGISKEVKEYQGGGFFKYYELEQYEEALANCKYEDGDLFNSPLIKEWTAEGRTGYWSGRSPYQEYVFLKDEKMLKALEIDYEKGKVKVDLPKLYPNIDIVETLSNLIGKWIKKISDSEVEFEDGTKINLKDLDYKLIKPLIWWE